MLKVAVLDDEEIFCQAIEKKIYAIFKDTEKGVRVDCYTRAKALFYEVDDGAYYDIYVLDIDLPDMGGIDLAKKLRAASEYCYIIFLTAHPQFAIEGYDAKAYQYIIKDEWEEKLMITLKNIEKEMSSNAGPFYRIMVSSRYEKIPIKDIYYVYKEGKNAVFMTKSGESSIRKSLAEVCQELPEEEFIQVDRSYIVNLSHVMKMMNREVYISNGQKIPVSRPQAERVKQKINAYWRKNEW